MRLDYPADAVVVVAGLPGAGKTRLIRRTVSRADATVVDTDDRRDAGARRARALLYGGHYVRIAGAIASGRPVIVHTRGTHGTMRRAIAVGSLLRGRPAHLILLDADRAEADDGQRRRGRTLAARAMERQAERWLEILERHRRGDLRREGWRSVVVLGRADAERVGAIGFATAAATAAVPAAPGLGP